MWCGLMSDGTTCFFRMVEFGCVGDPRNQQGIVQAGGGSILVWCVFTCRELVPLLRLNTSLSGDFCVALLGKNLQPFTYFMNPHTDGILQ
jgi:hypothetical protein